LGERWIAGGRCRRRVAGLTAPTALVYGDEDRSGIESFEFTYGGSAGFGGGLRCANIDGDPQRELILRFYGYARDSEFYEATEVAYDLEGAQATERSSQTNWVLTETVDDAFRRVSCEG